ncbi:arsenate reductase (glutaredoxin) [Candidatus Nitrosacidococcus tergens]|uniref:Arsenate reductase n=1 Tax=Candidatus Nitrosacidococcus tergens TaxID=553981 RepID=A0A7G1Q951_9GAMM|nr:arsenate reductase (glutaredoxin) [Candidatus Nitrosacidococcus tergens]CAB1275665.1 putative oxidoreductase [Candidatus Nitrosacidococcus tergens]
MVLIYHNPRCSKSRQALQLIHDQDIDPEIVEYLTAPPTFDQLVKILNLLGKPPRELIRQGEPEYKIHGLDNPNLSDKELIEAMCAYPILIERPIVLAGGRAVIGRPPESILEIL